MYRKYPFGALFSTRIYLAAFIFSIFSTPASSQEIAKSLPSQDNDVEPEGSIAFPQLNASADFGYGCGELLVLDGELTNAATTFLKAQLGFDVLVYLSGHKFLLGAESSYAIPIAASFCSKKLSPLAAKQSFTFSIWPTVRYPISLLTSANSGGIDAILLPRMHYAVQSIHYLDGNLTTQNLEMGLDAEGEMLLPWREYRFVSKLGFLAALPTAGSTVNGSPHSDYGTKVEGPFSTVTRHRSLIGGGRSSKTSFKISTGINLVGDSNSKLQFLLNYNGSVQNFKDVIQDEAFRITNSATLSQKQSLGADIRNAGQSLHVFSFTFAGIL